MPTPYKTTSLHSPPISAAAEIFAEKYGLLLQWALRLAEGNREQAEDLLHEAFVQFTLRQPDLSGIENLDGYLYAVLKHLHLAQLRRAKHDPLRQISLVEFDSVDLALRSSYNADQIDVQNDLRRTCAFLCWRKASAKSASFLILRFFHGYYPEELVRIARTSRNVVDHGIRDASAEAKLCLTSPGKLHFMQGRTKDKQRNEFEFMPDFEPRLFAVPAAEFLHALNEIILSSRMEACLPPEELLRHYETPSLPSDPIKEDNAPSIGRSLLAHLVSCPQCLDAVNHHLQMPPLSDRFPGERLGRYRRGSAENGSAIRRAPKGERAKMRYEKAFQEMLSAKGRILGVAQTRLRECFEHRPKTLFVAVNGEIVAAQDVGSDHNKQYIRITHEAPIDFIEIFSEQGVRLAFISTPHKPLDGPETISQKIPLSAGRSLQAVLELTSSDLTLEVIYSDSLLANAIDLSTEESDQSLQSLTALTMDGEIASEPREHLVIEIFNSLRVRFADCLVAFRPLLLASTCFLFFGVVAGLCFPRSGREIHQAEALLTAAAQKENSPIAAGHLTHRVLVFEVTSLDGGQSIQSGTVDIWRSADKNQLAIRFSSQNGKLQNGMWKAADGTFSAYKGHELADHAAAPIKLRDAITVGDTESMWMNEPSATAFKEIAQGQGAMLVHSFHNNSMINYQSASQEVDTTRPHLVDAVITLDGNRHAVSQALWIERNGEIRRYSYREIRYEDREATSSDAGVFSPDANLTRHHESAGTDSPSFQSTADLLTHLNLQAFVLLNSVNADSGEQITVSRSEPHRLSIHGVLSSKTRLLQVRHALAPLDRNPLVNIALASADQLKVPAPVEHSSPVSSAVAIESYEIDARSAPAQQPLKTYFSRRGYSGEELNKQIQSFGQATLGHSSRALQEAWVLHSLATSFSMSDMQHMSPDDRAQWTALYLRHFTTLQPELRAMHQSLDVLSSNGSIQMTEARPASADSLPPLSPIRASIDALSDQLLKQTSESNRDLRSALTASCCSPQGVDTLCRKLQLSLANTDQVVREIGRRTRSFEVSQVAR